MRWTKYHSGQLHYRLQRPNLLLTLKVACGTVEMKNTALIKRKSIVCSSVDTLDLLPCGILQIVGNNRTNSPRPNLAAAKTLNNRHVRYRPKKPTTHAKRRAGNTYTSS